jgi:hypothetical protein
MSSPLPDMTWPALLAHWTAFAQSSLALPKNADGERWRGAVSSIINLQAVTFALDDLEKLTADGERALALDKSEIIIRSATGQLHALWRGDQLPGELAALIHDAGVALEAAKGGGTEWRVIADRLVTPHPGELVDRLIELGFEGDLYVPTPGVVLFQGSPAAYASQPDGARPDEHVLRAVKEFLVDVSRPERVPALRQVYRQFDFAKGGPVRDLVVMGAANRPSQGGQPLLVPAIRGGKPIGVTLPPRKGVEIPTLPVVFQDVPTD